MMIVVLTMRMPSASLSASDSHRWGVKWWHCRRCCVRTKKRGMASVGNVYILLVVFDLMG